MITTRLVKVAMTASCALFALVVGYDNLVDYGSNYEFVRHTLSMDTTFAKNVLRSSRAVTSPTVLSVAYAMIIAGELLTGLLLALGTLRLALVVRAPTAEFNAAKSVVVLGFGLAFLLWFTGFLVIGGEWFAMWQSKDWNGVPSAFRFDVILLLVLIFVMQRDDG